MLYPINKTRWQFQFFHFIFFIMLHCILNRYPLLFKSLLYATWLTRKTDISTCFAKPKQFTESFHFYEKNNHKKQKLHSASVCLAVNPVEAAGTWAGGGHPPAPSLGPTQFLNIKPPEICTLWSSTLYLPCVCKQDARRGLLFAPLSFWLTKGFMRTLYVQIAGKPVFHNFCTYSLLGGILNLRF